MNTRNGGMKYKDAEGTNEVQSILLGDQLG